MILGVSTATRACLHLAIRRLRLAPVDRRVRVPEWQDIRRRDYRLSATAVMTTSVWFAPRSPSQLIGVISLVAGSRDSSALRLSACWRMALGHQSGQPSGSSARFWL